MEYVPGTDSEYWRSVMERGHLLCDRGRCEPGQPVREGERFLQIEPDTIEPPINPDISILYEDTSIVVINKPAPLPVHPSGRFNRNTLLYILSQIYSPEKLRIAHRLDANTTGLVVVCRKYSSSSFVQQQFSEGKVDKVYLARVCGVPTQTEFECDMPILDEADRAGARTIDPAGQSCLTKFRLLKSFADGTSLLQAIPVTGRTNQIRVHLWHLGMPVMNDPLYLPWRCMQSN
jgi:RluA family pseudouridine synthase